MKVVLFKRNSTEGFSLESVTNNIAKNLSAEVDIKIHTSRYTNKGTINKIKSAIDAVKYQGDVNHIMGDIHFLTYFFTKKKTILTIADCEKLMSFEYGYFKKKLYKLFWFTLAVLRCSIITTISEESKKNLSQYAGLKNRHIEVIHCGVDPHFKNLHLNDKEKRTLLKNKDGQKTVMHIGHTKPNKNISGLIRALDGLNVKFIKVGELNDDEILLLEQCNIDYLRFKNIDISLLVKIYNAVDCLVFPSFVEGFGMPVIEAQKCECPVVTSNTSSLPEVSGDGAVFVDPHSVESIKNGIKIVLKDKNQRMKIVENGIKNAKRFDWNNIAKQYYELYKEIYNKS